MLSRSDIERALAELDAALVKRGSTAELVLAGGAAVVFLLRAREATKDLDAIRMVLSDRAAFAAAVQEVAAQLGLPADWLNGRAAAFAVDVLEGKELWRGTALTVRAAAAEQLVAMKLSALRDDVDFDDARRLLQTLSGTKEEVWERLQPYLVPGMEQWKRQNFDAIWEELHGSP